MNIYTVLHVVVFRSGRNSLSRSLTHLVAQPPRGSSASNFQLGLPLSPIAESRKLTKRVSPEGVVQRLTAQGLKSTGYPQLLELHPNRTSELLPQSKSRIKNSSLPFSVVTDFLIFSAST